MVSEKLKHVICEHLALGQIEITDSTVASEIPGWDSLSHVEVLAAVESAYGVRFSILEVIRLKNIGALQALVDRKLAEK